MLGSINDTTVSNRTVGTGGALQEKIVGLAQRVSDEKNKFVAPLSYMGTEGQNIFRLLEDTIQLLGEVASTVATHTHRGLPPPDQASTFNQQANKAKTIYAYH